MGLSSSSAASSSLGEQEISKKRKSQLIQKYSTKYLQYGFTFTMDENAEAKPQCLVSNEVLTNHSMKPSLLKRHFLGKHSSLKDKPVTYFEEILANMQQSRKLIRKFTTSNEKSLKASYLVSLRIAKTAQPHTIAKRLILPVAKDLVENLIGEAQARKLDQVPVSNNTVCRRIQDMADYSKSQLVRRMAESPFFAIQLDESTDVTNFPQLLVYVQYIYDFEMIEDFLFCKPLEGRTTSVEIFKVLNDFIEQNGISWEKCVWVCSDGACAMIGRHSGVVTRIQSVAPNAVFTHCSIHREALAARTLQSSFKDVLDNAIKVVNLIKARTLNSRMFTIMCNDMSAEHDKLLLHTDVRWLSRGKVLLRLFELRAEVRLFLIDINSPFQNLFCDDVWLSKLAYLADIFRFLNELNLSLQGATVDIFQVSDKINNTVRKLQLRLVDIEKSNLAAFLLLCEFISENDLHIDNQLKSDIAQHCRQLIKKFHFYFQKIVKNLIGFVFHFQLLSIFLMIFQLTKRILFRSFL